jgi:hypothetical protein
MIVPLVGDGHPLENQGHETTHEWRVWIIEIPEHGSLFIDCPRSAMVEITAYEGEDRFFG